MDGGGSVNSSIGIAAGLGAAGGSGFVLSYLLVAMLFALPCSVPCLNATMACVACEACPDDCCMGLHEGEGHAGVEEDSELIHTQRKKRKKKQRKHGRNAASYQRLQGQQEEEVAFDRVRYTSGATNYRLHEKLLDQSQHVVSPTSGATAAAASMPADDATMGPSLPSTGPPPGPPPILSNMEGGTRGNQDDDDDDYGDNCGSGGDDGEDYDDLEMGVHLGDHAGEGNGGGHFGTFLILVELLASIPESMLLAAGLAEGKTPTAILASVIILNFAAGFAMFVDLIRPAATGNLAYGERGHTEARIHQLMFLATSAAAGMLIFSIAAEVYVEFEEKDPECSELGTYNPLLELFGGTLFGGFLVILLVWLSGSRYAHRYKGKLMHKLSCFRRRASRSSSTTSTSSSSSSVCSLSNEYLKAFVLVLFLSLWLFLLTIFGYLIFTGASGSNNFIEGISGGAFIITIGGTLIPEAQKSAQLSGWSSLRKEIISAITFLLGFLAAVVVVVFAEEEHACIPKSSLNSTATP